MDVYNHVGKAYSEAKREWQKKHTDPGERFVLQYIGDPSGKVLLDLGCGAGEEAAKYEQMGFAQVYGVDPSSEMLAQAKATVSHPGNFSLGSYEQAGCADNSVDVAVGLYSFNYTEDLDVGYREVARILKPQGNFVFAVRHPFFDLTESEWLTKNGIAYVRPTIYEKVPIEQPFHAIADYFSPTFLELFDVKAVEEWDNPAAGKGSRKPFLLGIAAQKK